MEGPFDVGRLATYAAVPKEYKCGASTTTGKGS